MYSSGTYFHVTLNRIVALEANPELIRRWVEMAAESVTGEPDMGLLGSAPIQ